MKSNYYLFLLISISFFTTSAWGQRGPGLKWVSTINTELRNELITADTNFNTFTAGYVVDTTSYIVDGISYPINPINNISVGFITKIDYAGDLTWLKTIGGSGGVHPTSILTSSAGELYITGRFYDTIDFDPGPGVFNLIGNNTPSFKTTFILKLDNDGNFVWAKSLLGTTAPGDIDIDLQNNLILPGYFQDSLVDLNPDTGVFDPLPNKGTFLLNLSPKGKFNWCRIISSQDNAVGYSNPPYITISDSGHIFASGMYAGNTVFITGNSPTTLTSKGSTDIYIQKLDSTGNQIWLKTIGGTDWDYPNAIVIDSLNNAYIGGGFSNIVDFDPGTGTLFANEQNVGEDFLLKLNTNGVFQWVKHIDTVSANGEIVNDVQVNGDGSIYMLGKMNPPGLRIFDIINKISPAGNIIWSDTIISGYLKRFAINKAEGIKIIGHPFYIQADLDPDTSNYGLTYDTRVIIHLSDCITTYGADSIVNCGPYTWVNGITYDSSIIFTDTIPNKHGCDSIVNMNLTILDPGTSSTDSYTQCTPLTWIDGVTYNKSNNTAKYHFPNHFPNGCDSIVYLDLTINAFDSTDVIEACNSYTWINGLTYTSSNYSDSVINTNALGCDSIIYLHLTIQDSLPNIDTVVACGSYTWVDGISYSSNNNTAIDTLTNSFGCDSVVQLNLTILPTFSSVDSVSSCGAITWFDGNTYSSSTNSPTFTFTAINGCDSVVTLNYTRHPSNVIGYDYITGCDSLTWINGVTYYGSTYLVRDTIVGGSQYGCDSISILMFTESSNQRTEVYNECNSFTWINGVTYTASNNTDSVVYTNALGCDSTIYLDLTINYTTTYTDVITACDSIIWIDGLTYTSSNNTAIDTLVNSAGCDSIVTLNLTITNSSLSSSTASACGSYAWANTGVTYYNTGVYYDTLVNGAGCDSIVSLDLTIHPIYNQTETYTSCDSFTWSDGITYTTSNNTATQFFTSTKGCDSIVNLDLTIYPSFDTTETYVLCDSSFTWIDGITYTASNSTALHTFTSVNGCDSVISLNLTLTPIDTSVNRTTLQLQANHSGASYQWLDCEDNYSAIPGETNRILVITESGSYAVQITNSNCVDTSSCFEFVNVGVNDISINHNINVYPNPTSDFIIIDLQNVTQSSASIRIIDLNGKAVYHKSVTKTNSPWTEQVDLSGFATGSYFVKIVIAGEESSFAVSKL